MIKIKCIQIFSLVCIWHFTFAQDKPKASFGTLDSIRVSVAEFDAQKDLKIQDGYNIDSAVVYFSGANFKNTQIVNFIPTFDSLTFLACKKLLVPGSAVVFEMLVKEKVTNGPFKVTLPFIFYSMTKSHPVLSSASYDELKKFINLDFRSGTIYFSGDNFANVVSLSIRPKKLLEAKMYFDRCGPGSIITFDNVTFKDERNSIQTLSTTLRLQ